MIHYLVLVNQSIHCITFLLKLFLFYQFIIFTYHILNVGLSLRYMLETLFIKTKNIDIKSPSLL